MHENAYLMLHIIMPTIRMHIRWLRCTALATLAQAQLQPFLEPETMLLLGSASWRRWNLQGLSRSTLQSCANE